MSPANAGLFHAAAAFGGLMTKAANCGHPIARDFCNGSVGLKPSTSLLV